VRFRVGPGRERRGVHTRDRRNNGVMSVEDDSALTQTYQPRHLRWRDVVRPQAVDNDYQIAASGRRLCTLMQADRSDSGKHREESHRQIVAKARNSPRYFLAPKCFVNASVNATVSLLSCSVVALDGVRATIGRHSDSGMSSRFA